MKDLYGKIGVVVMLGLLLIGGFSVVYGESAKMQNNKIESRFKVNIQNDKIGKEVNNFIDEIEKRNLGIKVLSYYDNDDNLMKVIFEELYGEDVYIRSYDFSYLKPLEFLDFIKESRPKEGPYEIKFKEYKILIEVV